MPETRRWKEPPERGGMVPTAAMDAEGWRQYHRFMATVDKYMAAVGTDGRRAFAVPVDASSTDPSFRALDDIAMVRRAPIYASSTPVNNGVFASCSTRCFVDTASVFNGLNARLFITHRTNGWIQMGSRLRH
eukprot:COSAG02_NODE_9200_length_2291_cov_1.577555_3_plen_132_part_00